MSDKNALFRYFLAEYFDNNIEEMAYQTGFKKSDLIAWKDDIKKPTTKKYRISFKCSINTRV